MTVSFRRFEILLPRLFNDGQPVPDALFAETALELRQQFGAVSSETQLIKGLWQREDYVYRDDLIRFFVDVPDRPEARQFFVDYKAQLKRRFQQIDIWITSYPIELV